MTRVPTAGFSANVKTLVRNMGGALAKQVTTGFHRLGFAVNRFRPDYHYCPDIYGRSFHKLLDIRDIEPFPEGARKVIDHGRTGLYYDRLYFIYQALLNVGPLMVKAPNVAEVGVFRGGGTFFMATVVESLGSPNVTIHGFDTFEGHPAGIDQDLDGPHKKGFFSNTTFEEVSEYLAGYDNVILYKGRFQDRCQEVAGKKFCFVHLDVDIYSGTRDCLDFFSGRMAPGGVIVVDDYRFSTCKGVLEAVEAFVKRNAKFVRFDLNTGQCLLLALPR